MPSLSTTVTTTATRTVKLAPRLKQRLLTKLRTYAGLKMQYSLLDGQMKDIRNDIGEIMEQAGESSIKIDGYSTTLVAPIRRTLDEKKLLAQGVTMEQIKAATVETPTTPYVKVSVPTLKDVSEDEG